MFEYISRRGHVLPSCAHCPHIDTESKDIFKKYNAHEKRFAHQNPGLYIFVLMRKDGPVSPKKTAKTSDLKHASTNFGMKR